MNSVNTDLVNNLSKFFGVIKLNPFEISESLKFLKDDRTELFLGVVKNTRQKKDVSDALQICPDFMWQLKEKNLTFFSVFQERLNRFSTFWIVNERRLHKPIDHDV